MQHCSNGLLYMAGLILRDQLNSISDFGVVHTAIDRYQHEFIRIYNVTQSLCDQISLISSKSRRDAHGLCCIAIFVDRIRVVSVFR